MHYFLYDGDKILDIDRCKIGAIFGKVKYRAL